MASNKYDGSDEAVLKRFMQEFFPYAEFKKASIFTKEMKGDYQAQAKKICDMLGYKTVFEYGAKEISCHITYAEEKGSPDNKFITTIENIYGN